MIVHSKYIFCVAVLLSFSTAHARTIMMECTYTIPDRNQVPILESPMMPASEVPAWLKTMAADKSIPNWNSKPECHALSKDPVWNFLSQSEGGTVSLIHNLTQDQCESMKHDLDPVYQYCGDNHTGTCTFTGGDGDIKTSECFK